VAQATPLTAEADSHGAGQNIRPATHLKTLLATVAAGHGHAARP
jgi:hypothetical protein